MSARQALEERIAALDRQIRRIQAPIDRLKSRDLPSADLERSLLLLLETRRPYVDWPRRCGTTKPPAARNRGLDRSETARSHNRRMPPVTRGVAPTRLALMRIDRWICVLACALQIASVAHAQSHATDGPPLFDRLAGHWVMSGRIADKQTTHDLDVEWVLRQGYLRMHERSRETDAGGLPAYEAIVFLGWDAKAKEYRCLWLDSTSPNGLVPQGIARGTPADGAIPLVFALSPRVSIATTFRYDAGSDTWQLTIDDTSEGKSDRFADLRLTRAPSGR